MSEATSNNSILDALTIGDPMSQHHGIKCCPAIRESTDERYIVKILSIPASAVQLDALLLTGAYPTPSHALEYFRERAEDVLKEVEVLNKLHAMEGFLPFTHAEIRKAPDGVGYQVYLISPYKRSLERQMQLEPLTHLGAVNLGLDLCAALAICRRAGYLYMDLKPSNVYITPNQGYRISDLGFIPLSSLKYASYPEQYRSPYTAPEITDAMSALNNRIDIYALGLILYQVYNNGQLPAETGVALPPPAYADYEIAEIILKACDPDPTRRWADPLQMGQAMVAYMQRNSVNDTPIVPPPVEIPEEPVDAEQPDNTDETNAADQVDAALDSILEELGPIDTPEEEAPEGEAFDNEASLEDMSSAINIDLEPEPAVLPDLDLSFIENNSEDETVPSEESLSETGDSPVSDEVQEILARADELICHELPEPAVAPDPIEVPFPAPITLPNEPEVPAPVSSEDDQPDVPSEEDCLEDISEEDVSEEPDTEGSTDVSDVSEDAESEAEAEAGDDTDTEDDIEDWNDEEDDEYRVSEYYSDNNWRKSRHRHLGRNLIIIVSCLAIVAALITGGIMFYRYYYLQPVTSFTVSGSVNSLTATISSSIKDELLAVVCIDTYGNTRVQEVVNGRAYFNDLTPGTQYRLELNISGFHKLNGVTTTSYTTTAQTEILDFNAVAGPENGSVILSFAVNGSDSENWTVAYYTGNSPELTTSFTGHTVTITDLIVGSEYLFRLIPNDSQYLTGTWQLRYTAQQIVYAQELSIRSFIDGTLVAVWNAPEGLVGQNWNVRCYNDNGFDQTVMTSDSQVQFTELDPAYGYTIEVTAVGMTQSATATVSANPITLTSISASAEKNNVLKLDWAYVGEAPADGWILDYTVNGSDPITLSCPENSAQITKFPGCKYEIDVRPVGEITYFGKHLSYEVDEAAKFSSYNVTADDMSFYMCRTPKKDNWDRFDVPRSDYTETFQIGEKASFLVELWKNPKKSSDKITVTYVISTEDGIPVSLNTTENTWKKLWDKKFCELDIPKMPETAGKYTIDIYFNGKKINKDVLSFSIT